MAYQSYFPDDEEKKKAAQGGSAVISGSGGEQTSGPGGSIGSGFVNLDKYLSANKGQSSGLASALTDDYSKDVEKGATTIQDLNKQAQKEIQDKTKNQQTSGLVDNTGAANTGGNIQDWANNAGGIINSNYQQGLSDQTQNSINTTINDQNQLKTNLGQIDDRYFQQGKLRDKFNQRGSYSSGFGALDTFLLNADPESRAKIEQTKGLAGNIDYSSIGQDAIAGYEDAAAKEFAANQKKIRDAAGNLQQDYRNKYKDAERQAAYENAYLDEKQNVLNEYLKYVKGTPIGTYLPDDLSSLVQREGNYTAGNYFADQDATDLAALDSLLGVNSGIDTRKGTGSVGIDYDAIMANQTGPRAGYQGYHEFDYDPRTNQIKSRFVNYESGPQEWSTGNISDIDPGLAQYIQGRGY